MEQFKVILATRAKSQLLSHVSFLSRVSHPAAKRLRDSFGTIKSRLEDNPFQFPLDPVFAQLKLPYRSALFEGRYKVLFTVEDRNVFIDSVVDCRQNLDVDSDLIN